MTVITPPTATDTEAVKLWCAENNVDPDHALIVSASTRTFVGGRVERVVEVEIYSLDHTKPFPLERRIVRYSRPDRSLAQDAVAHPLRLDPDHTQE